MIVILVPDLLWLLATQVMINGLTGIWLLEATHVPIHGPRSCSGLPQDVQQISGAAVQAVCNANGGSLKCQILRVGLDQTFSRNSLTFQ